MQEILNHTHSYNYNWSQSIKDYQNKYNLSCYNSPPVKRISDRMIKDNDRVYNPILQIYNDQNKESSLRKTEKENLINTIIKNQDTALKTEQTFNIINLKDKLKGLENDPNYPKPKTDLKKRKNMETSRCNYNIISNLPLSQHHFDKPENRPKCDFSEPHQNKISQRYANVRDYDIISTRYKQFHDEKTKIDNEIKKIQTAKLFYKRNDYNIIKGRFFDDTKEENFRKQRSYEQSIHGLDYKKNMPQCAKGQSDLYNLINMQTVNAEELKKADETEKNKKRRYEIKYEMDKFYHDKNLYNKDKKEYNLGKKYSYLRYKESDKRQYDIIDLKDKPFREHTKCVNRDNMTDWEKLVNGAGKNNTFKDKEIYKDLYDYSETGKNYDNFKNTRQDNLSKLPQIDKDKNFESKIPHRQKNINADAEPKEVKINVRERMIQFDKEKFFKPPKNIYFEKEGIPIIRKNPEMNKVSDRVEENKEKNMRNKLYTKDMLSVDS